MAQKELICGEHMRPLRDGGIITHTDLARWAKGHLEVSKAASLATVSRVLKFEGTFPPTAPASKEIRTTAGGQLCCRAHFLRMDTGLSLSLSLMQWFVYQGKGQHVIEKLQKWCW